MAYFQPIPENRIQKFTVGGDGGHWVGGGGGGGGDFTNVAHFQPIPKIVHR